MDNLNLNSLFNSINEKTSNPEEAIQSFLNSNLSPEQKSKLQNILSNPQLIKSLLSSDTAKNLLSKFGKE